VRRAIGSVRRVSDKVAVLFWFYRDLPICRNRLDLLRRDNPDTQIFGLYGGSARDRERFRAALAPQLDDFWSFDKDVTSKWKWLNGDLMLARWFAERGHELDWTHVFVVQWDMLVLESIATLVPPLEPDDVLLSGVRPVSEVGERWVWVRGGHAPRYEAFLASFEKQYGAVEPMSCLFIVAGLPRRLLEAYGELEEPEVGYVEYRLPTLAAAQGLRLIEDERFAAWQPATGGTATRRQRLVNASRRPVLLPTVLLERLRTDGARVFHPYHGLFPMSPHWALRTPGWAAAFAARSGRAAISARLSRLGQLLGGSESNGAEPAAPSP
jgi:hypothetical protein